MPRPEPSPLLHTHFRRQAAATPDRIALHDDGATVRYEELTHGAARLAGALRAGGIGPGRYVGLHLERSLDSILATLAILDAGAAVVPLPPSYPEARRREILEFSDLDGVIDGPATPIGALYRGPVFRADATSGATLAEPELVSSDDPAFVLCSSGSTGTPKLIVRSHRSFFHRLEWTWRRLPFQPGERCCQKSHMTTTHAIYELFEPLLAGVPVTVIGDAGVRNLEGFWETIRTEAVTRLLIAPSLLRASLDMPGFVAPPLRALTLMGEAVDGALADLAVAAFAGTPSIVSIYGSTESSSSLVADLRTPRQGGEAPALGVPLDDTIEAVVLDEALRPVADGKPGMLYLAGPQLFTEYAKDPAGTAAAYADCPDGQRRYRTDDLVRRGEDGSLHFVGRTGDTVKVRGFRVDLREVEAALAAAPGVSHAAAVPVENGLAAFVAPATVSTSEVTRVLKDRLPAQMIPSTVVALAEFPRAANGKIDRRRLAADWAARPAAAEVLVGTELERRVAAVWREVLGPAAITPTTNFFEAGGTSLTVFAVVHRLRSALGLTQKQLTDLSIYRYPTVEALALHLSELASGAPQSADPTAGIVVSLSAGADHALDPVFLIAPAGGALGPYDKVVARLTGPRPLLGIRDPFLWDGRDLGTGFGGWIDCYLAAIRDSQPTGPYRIVAYSSAGALGYEIARRLRQDGAEVARLILVDPVALDSSSWRRYGYWTMLARGMPPLLVRVLLAGGRLRALIPGALRGRASRPSEWNLAPAAFARFEDEVRRNRAHLQRLSVLLELSSGLPVALSDAELDATPPEGYEGLLLERLRQAGSDIDAHVFDRMVVQYEVQVRTQHAYRLRPFDGDTFLFSPASPYARFLAVQFGPYLRRLDARALPLGTPSEEVRELTRNFHPGIRSHYLCMRDDTFTAALAAELDRLLCP
jgi:amino acid adenylation domain-containing protein